jgi:rod shape-determining protein MreC
MIRLSYFLLGVCLFGLVNVPREWADGVRAHVVILLSPAWRAASCQTAGPALAAHAKQSPTVAAEIAALRSQIETLQEWISDEKQLQKEADRWSALLSEKDQNKLKAILQKKFSREKQLLAMRYASMPAQVVFRDPSSWGSTIWIALGEADNRALGRTVIRESSPVLADHSLIGVVEYVGESQARVRLITDAGLAVAVRAVRGGAQNRELSHHVKILLDQVQARPDLFASAIEQERFITLVQAFQERVGDWDEEWLAKGEICGCSAPLWRARGSLLKGIGFNYEYPDEEGPARDLRSGRPIGASTPAMPLIQNGDLLATSGLDGVFPPGIPVAIATRILPLTDESHSYEIEAGPAAGDLQDLSIVFVLPPLGFSDID